MISRNLKKRSLTSLSLLFLVLLIFNSSFFLVYALLILGVFSILEFLNISKKLFSKTICYISNIIFIIFIAIFSLFFFLLSVGQLKIVLFIILFGCIASDIGGFVFGNIIKGPKLTKISPKKTVSGSFGSFISCSIVVMGLIFFITKNININIFFISVFTSLSCQLGDLFFSFLKRKAKIKDYSSLLPGHGGAIDRLDGIFFGVPVGLLFFLILY